MDIVGIVIRNVDYGEKDKLVTVATQRGLFLVRAKGVRSNTSKLKSAIGLLSFGEFSLAEGKGGYTLSGAEISESFYECWTDGEKYSAAMACIEIYEKCSRVGETLNLAQLLRALKNINYGEFYPIAEALVYGVKCAVDIGIDVTEKVFPEKVCLIFSSLCRAESAETVLTEYTREDINMLVRHLVEGFWTETNLKITNFSSF